MIELTKSKGEARRLIQGKGARFGEQVIDDANEIVSSEHFEDGRLILRAGKKRFKLVILSD